MILRKSRLLVLALILVSLSAFGRSHNLEATDGLLDSSSQREKDFVEPQAIAVIEAPNPGKARESGKQGPVVVEVSVNELGDVYSARALTGERALRPEAVKAARQWTFKPARLKGKPVKTLGAITFCFSVHSAFSTSRYTFAFERCCPDSRKRAKAICSNPSDSH